MYAYEIGCFILGQDQRETSCIFVKKKKRCFYTKHSYLTSKLQALKGETLLLEIFERIHEYVWR